MESVVFFGSGPVAAKSLALIAKTFPIEAIITKPRTVREMSASSPDTPVHTVTNKQELNELIAREKFTSRLAMLIDFGIIVSQEVIDSFPLGIVNSHFSILPEWRGADPISFAILSGQPTTGVSLMIIEAGLDTGKVLVTKSLPIKPEDTTPTLTEKLINLSSELLKDYLPRYLSGEVKPRSQSHPERATYSRKLTKEDGVIDWTKPAEQIEREIRAFIEWPKSRTTLAGKDVVVLKAHVVDQSGEPGSVSVANKQIIMACGQQSLVLDLLKPAGKNEMTAAAFLAGYGQLLQS